MQISSRFTIAVHVLVCIQTFQNQSKVTSELLASSVNVNPVVIRRLLQQLKKAGIVQVARGSGGAAIAMPPEQLTLLDVYRAVGSVGQEGLFHFHQHPNPACPVGRSIHAILDGHLAAAQQALEQQLQAVTLRQLMEQAAPLLPPQG